MSAVTYPFHSIADADHLRHSKFIGLREDKDPLQAVKEHPDEKR
jgi:hypothetical protein